jgi:hypothetical protein
MDRSIILASFVSTERLETFLDYLIKRFKMNRDRIFVYKNEDEPTQNIVTYKVFLKNGKRVDLKSIYPTTIIVHKKGECFYTINALNSLIEREHNLDSGNIEHKNYQIDWEKFQNKMILTNKEGLVVNNIKRVFS